jgi:hypothetical protein
MAKSVDDVLSEGEQQSLFAELQVPAEDHPLVAEHLLPLAHQRLGCRGHN